MFSVRTFAAGALLGVVLCVGIQGFTQQKGLELQAETGRCYYHKSPDGMFYQARYQTNNYLDPACNSFAISGMVDDTRGWRIAFHDFGTIRARDNRFILRDDEYAHPPSTPCDTQTNSGCYGSMYGEGTNRGVSFSLTKRVPIQGIDLLGEVGLLFFNSEFHAWAQKDSDHQILYAKEESSWKVSPPAPLFGVGVRWENLYIMARRYVSLGHRAESLTDHNVFEFSAGVAIPL
jgi:hypothetical protein